MRNSRSERREARSVVILNTAKEKQGRLPGSLLASRFSLLLALLAGCGPHTKAVSATGTIEYTETDVAPDLGGRLGVLRAHEGDRVAAGGTVAIPTAAP